MTKQEFLRLLDEIVEVDPGTLEGNMHLEEIETWDSFATMGFIALVDEQFNLTLSPKEIIECETIDDLVDLLNGQIAV